MGEHRQLIPARFSALKGLGKASGSHFSTLTSSDPAGKGPKGCSEEETKSTRQSASKMPFTSKEMEPGGSKRASMWLPREQYLSEIESKGLETAVFMVI